MDIFTVLILLIVFAIAIWAINTYLPGDPAVKGIVILVLILVLLFVVLRASGVLVR